MLAENSLCELTWLVCQLVGGACLKQRAISGAAVRREANQSDDEVNL